MFRKIAFLRGNITSILQSPGCKHQFHCNATAFVRVHTNADSSTNDDDHQKKPNRKKSDFSTVIDLEANLFENSARKNDPVDSRQLLQQFKVKPNNGKPNRNKFARTEAATNVQRQQQPQQQPRKPKVKSDEIVNTTLGVTYTKLHLDDPWLAQLLLSVKSRKSREKKHQLLVEGRRLILDAISAGLPLDYVLFSDMDQLLQIKDRFRVDDFSQPPRLVKVPQSDLRFWSHLSTCPGLMAIFTKPLDMSTIWQRNRASDVLPITVICDQIREPNNLGSIIRNCAAIGCAQVITVKGCADAWESKALRGGAGGQFLVPVRGPVEWSSVPSMLPADVAVYLAENNAANAIDRFGDETSSDDGARTEQMTTLAEYSEVQFGGGHVAVVIGGETHGISADAYRMMNRIGGVGQCVHIPLAGKIDSLNSSSALAVILFEIRRQLLLKT